MYVFLVPVNAGRNAICRVSVSVLPAADTLDPLPLNTHWLFCSVPLPGAIELAGCAPASVNNASVFSARLYSTAQALVALAVELKSTPTVVRSVAASESVAWKMNVCCVPTPEAGVTARVTTGGEIHVPSCVQFSVP